MGFCTCNIKQTFIELIMSKDKAYKKLQHFEDLEIKQALLTILEAQDLIRSKLAKGNVSQNDKELTYDVIRDITSVSTEEHSNNSFSLEEVTEKNNIDNISTTQKVVDIKITTEDILALKTCIETNNFEFIKEFALKNDLAHEEAYSLLLTQIMSEHQLPNIGMTDLFKLTEPDLTIFNKHNGHSLVSVLLTFGTRGDVLFLKEYINKYDWEKVELDKADQEAIHNTLLMGNALEVTQNEYVEFVMNLLGDICSEQSIHSALYE